MSLFGRVWNAVLNRPAATPKPAARVRSTYDAAQSSKEHENYWLAADALNANASNDPSIRKILRERARYECQNNGYAGGLVKKLGNDLIGTCPRLQLSVPGVDRKASRRVEKAFAKWAKRVGLGQKLRLLDNAAVRDGEGFALLTTNPALSGGVRLDLRLYETDQVDTPWYDFGDPLAFPGGRLDDAGNVVEWHFLKSHPGSNVWLANYLDYDRIDAGRVIHWHSPSRPGELRGVPEILSSLSLYAYLRRYTLATVAAAETAAMFAGVLETDAPADTGETPTIETMDSIPMTRAALLTLPAGWKANQFKPEQPLTQYGQFKTEILTEAGQAVSAPQNIATGSSAAYNYSSGRLDHGIYQRGVYCRRSDVAEPALDKVFLAWAAEAFLVPGLLDELPPFSEWSWVWYFDGFSSLDPQKEAAARQTNLATGITTLAEVCAEDGKDWEEVVEQQAREKERREELGLAPPEAPPPAPGEPGKVRTFRLVANTGEPMLLAGFREPVVVDLSTIDLSGLPIPALYDHCPDVDFAVGQVTAARVEGSTLVAEGVFTVTEGGSPDRNYAKKVLEKADAGYRWQTSVGGDPKVVDDIKSGASVAVNGRTYPGPVCVARGLVLREISFVVLGGDRRTSAVVARSKLKGQAMKPSFEEYVQSMGFDPAALDETQMSNLKLQYATEYPEGGEGEEVSAEGEMPPEEEVTAEGEEVPPEEEEVPTNASAKKPALRGKAAQRVQEEIRAAAAKELTRHRQINTLATTYGNPKIKVKSKNGATVLVPFAEQAIRAGWNVTQSKAALLDHVRESRPQGPGVFAKGHDKSCTLQSLQGAMILRAGGKLDHPSYKKMGGVALLGKVAPWLNRDINDADRNRYMEAAHKYSNMSMVDLCRESLRLNGKDCPHDREDMIRAAFSGGGNLTNVFTTNVNAVLLATYDEFGTDTTSGWVSEVDVNDYKTNERPRVLVGDGLKKLPRGSEAQHTSYTDAVESYKIAKYARQFEIDEQDIVDDAFGVFADVPRAMGTAAARLRPDLVYGAVVLANPTLTATSLALFSDSNSPDNNRASSTLSHAALSASLAAMRLGRENSVNLNFEATHLIVPPTLEDTAIELTQSINIIAGGDTGISIRGETNSLSRRGLAVVAEPRLENGVTNPADESSQSGSASNWFLACARAHTVEVGYLKGTGRAPRVRATVLDKGRWGMNWDVELSIGVKALDFKGLFKMTT